MEPTEENSASTSASTDNNMIDIDEQLSHVDVVLQAKQLIADLLDDPFLYDLPKDSSAGEVSSLLALEQGKAITVNVRRMDEQILRKYCIHQAMAFNTQPVH